MPRAFENIGPQVPHADPLFSIGYGDDSVEVRTQVVYDSNWLDWKHSFWLPFWCPVCYVNGHKEKGIRHAFDYFVVTVDRFIEGWCELCGKYYQFAVRQKRMDN